MPYTRYHEGDLVRVRSDLIEHKRYYMDDEDGVSDSVIHAMLPLSGKLCVISEVTEFGKYRLHGSNYNWTDEMFETQEPEEELPSPESLSLLYDFMS